MDRTARTPTAVRRPVATDPLRGPGRPVVDIQVIDAEEAAAWDDYAAARGVARPIAA